MALLIAIYMFAYLQYLKVSGNNINGDVYKQVGVGVPAEAQSACAQVRARRLLRNQSSVLEKLE